MLAGFPSSKQPIYYLQARVLNAVVVTCVAIN